MAGQRSRVMIGIVDQFGVLQAFLGHHGGMPVRGPSFVHDFGDALRGEVVRFIANDGQHDLLPILNGSVVDQEHQDVFFRMRGKALPLFLVFFHLFLLVFQEVRRIDEVIHVSF